MPWSSSDRKSRLPSDWQSRRRIVLERCGYQCEHVRSSGRRCGSKATDVDHVQHGDDHSLSNLQGLCSWHHKQKTSRESQEAKAEIRASLKRPQEPDAPGASLPPRPVPGM
jgi:5-methylcytosine-specific restriction protein A